MSTVLVITQDYPSENNPTVMRYVHTRNEEYINQGIRPVVLSFSATENYVYEGIKVQTLNDYKLNPKTYDALISHAPNIRFHYRFFKKYISKFKQLIIFFHGHEVLNVNKIYPIDYPFIQQQTWLKQLKQEIYDCIKLRLWHNLLPRIAHKSSFIFVSKWMEEQFYHWTKIDRNKLAGHTFQIYNSIGSSFENYRFTKPIKAEYDFITIRGNIDGRKYGIDIVAGLAKYNPEKKFLIIGKGEYFKHCLKPDNITHLNQVLHHSEILDYLKKSSIALFPTRLDAQGVMACEIASCGMPLITSKIPVCEEVFQGFENVYFLPPETTNISLDPIIKELDQYRAITNEKFYAKNTTAKEIELIITLLERYNEK